MESLRNLITGLALACSISNSAYATREDIKTSDLKPRSPALESIAQEYSDIPKNIRRVKDSIEVYIENNEPYALSNNKRILTDPRYTHLPGILAEDNRLTIQTPKSKEMILRLLPSNPYVPINEKGLFILRTLKSDGNSQLSITPFKDGSRITANGPCIISNGGVSLIYDGTNLVRNNHIPNENDRILGKPATDYDFTKIVPLEITYPNRKAWIYTKDGKITVKDKKRDLEKKKTIDIPSPSPK